MWVPATEESGMGGHELGDQGAKVEGPVWVPPKRLYIDAELWEWTEVLHEDFSQEFAITRRHDTHHILLTALWKEYHRPNHPQTTGRQTEERERGRN